MRRITTHHTNTCNKQITLEASGHDVDNDGNGEVSPRQYTMHYLLAPTEDSAYQERSFAQDQIVLLQRGPIGKDGTGVNGVTIEVLLAICIDQLKCYQKSKFAHVSNEAALTNVYEALGHLTSRTRDRELRGVEGTHTP